MSLTEAYPEKKDIEFNTGFVVALALYYGHRSQFSDGQSFRDNDLRNYGASDHLYDMEYPMNLDPNLKKQIETFVDHAFQLRLKMITSKQGEELFEECLACLKEIDKRQFHVLAEVHYP